MTASWEIHKWILNHKFHCRLEAELVARLASGEDTIANEEDFRPKTEESKFGDKLLGKYLNPIGEKFKR